jgi:hypothetical protein
MITFSPDKFGYYQAGNDTSYSKYEAVEWAKRNRSKLKWNFNEEVYNAIDWKIDPRLNLWELYKDRARQIREAYDYVVLWYSGGSDSHNILMAWLDAGLKIDEIATTWNYETAGDKQSHYNAEIVNVVMPDVDKLKKAGHEFEFRVIDIGPLSVDLFDTWGTDFEYNINFHFSPNNPAKHLIRDKVEAYKTIIASGKKLCFVWGKEKPVLNHEDGRHYFHFTDNIDNCVGPYTQRNYYKGWYDELFYWTPDAPLIPVAQSHTILNYIRSSTNESDFEEKSRPMHSNGYSKRFNKYLRDDVVKTILYPKWSNDIFCNGKASSFTYSLRDEWFFKSNIDQRKRFIDITNSYFSFADPNNAQNRRNVIPQYSRRYWLE